MPHKVEAITTAVKIGGLEKSNNFSIHLVP